MDERHRPTRRDLLSGVAGTAATLAMGCNSPPSPGSPGAPSETVGAASDPAPRLLGKTGLAVGPVSLGGEGALRTVGQSAEAVPVVLEALRQGVRYCDTAPAYAQSQDYYGEAFRTAGAGSRERVTLATKTHERDRDGSLRLLDESLRRLGTDHVDIWQLHDLRDRAELDEIFAPNGAIHAVERAKADGRIKHVGITGHHDPDILMEAMARYDFDTVLCAMNPADPRRLPFLTTVVPEARRRGMGIIGMKVLAAGRLVSDGVATPEELIRYGLRYADTVIVGCKTAREVRDNLSVGRAKLALSDEEATQLEARLAPRAARYDTFKRA